MFFFFPFNFEITFSSYVHNRSSRSLTLGVVAQHLDFILGVLRQISDIGL